MKITRAGLGVLAASVICFIVGRVFGTLEAQLLAAIGFSTLAIAALYTAAARLDLRVQRLASPTRLRVGVPARVDLALTNRGRRPTPVLRADDQLSGRTGASLYLARIRRDGVARIAYRLPTARRGELLIGPLDLTVGDPLGLVRTISRAANQVRLVVRPQLMELGVLRATAGHEPTADQQPIKALASSGDEFFALRPYVVGDELRRVHWKSSARSGELVVRQEERPRAGRVTVVLDRRADVYDDRGFDRACSVAISALYAGWRSDDALRFLTTSPASLTDVRSRNDLDAIDEQLALLSTSRDASLIRTVDELARIGRGGTVVIITGSPGTELDAAVDRARRVFGVVLPVVCQAVERSSADNTEPLPSTTSYLIHDGTSDFATAWAGAWRAAS